MTVGLVFNGEYDNSRNDAIDYKLGCCKDLCGFANFGSIGIQLGGIGGMAPERKKDLSKLVTKAMIGGAIASWLTATIAGLII